MKKIKYIFLFILLALIPKTVSAQECTSVDLNQLKMSAFSTEVIYNYVSDNKYEIIFNNINDDFYIEDIKTGYKINKPKDSTVYILENYVGGNTYTFNFFGSEKSGCPHVLLRVQHLIPPKFNSFSQREECKGIEEFDLCSRWYPGEIKENEFKERTEAYKIKKEEANKPKDPINEPIEEKNNLWDTVMDFLNQQYILMLLGVVVLGIIGIVLLKVFKRR